MASAAFLPTASTYVGQTMRMKESRKATVRAAMGGATSTELKGQSKVDEGFLEKFIAAKESVLSRLVEALFKRVDEPNLYYQGNFGPVDEIGSWVPVQVIDGAVPDDFPSGTYIRNGPNPYLSTKCRRSIFGKSLCHWFEGDGMLHATRFEQGGKSIKYRNKYVDTLAHKFEKETGKTSLLHAIEGDNLAILMSLLFNMLRFAQANGPTCNTNIVQHGGKMFAVAEGNFPYEINTSDLSTVGSQLDFNGEWDVAFTSHPKVDLETGELVIFRFSAQKPYLKLGTVSKDWKLLRTVDMELERPTLIHELPITRNYNLIPDFPLTISLKRLVKGEWFLHFEQDSYSRIGIMPRAGGAESIKWFQVESGHSFHTVNAFEDGDEVIFHAIFARYPLFPTPDGMNRLSWFARAITPTDIKDAKDPLIDGALSANLREWRFNVTKGTVMERNLTTIATCGIEMPKINSSYCGRKNKFAYALVLDVDASRDVGMPKYGKMTKIHLPESAKDTITMEYHEFGTNRFGSEPLFVSRSNPIAEDDGWIVTYVHDETSNKSEVYIVDALRFEDKPVARIELPQRVPYGFHSDYFRDT